MTNIIAIGNQKGGVAKTTTCASLGACLAEEKKKVLLIDMDPQSNLTIAIGIDPVDLDKSVYHLFLQSSEDIHSFIHKTEYLNLHIIPSEISLALAEKDLYSVEEYEYVLKNRLAQIQGEYDHILIDCPPSIGILTLNALTAADLVIIPTQCEYFSAIGVENLLDVIRMIKERTNPSIKYMVLVTMYDQSNEIIRSIYSKIKEEFNHDLFRTVIEPDANLRECTLAGQPITLYSTESGGAKLYRSLAKEVLNNENQ